MSAVLRYIQSQPWLMTHEALDAMIAVVERSDVDPLIIANAYHGPRAAEALSAMQEQRRDDSRSMRMVGRTAVIPIVGPITRYADFFSEMSGGVTTASLAADFTRAINDPNVDAVLLRIDSPGGEVTGINELAQMIYDKRSAKPIWAYVEGIGASAAYWIAAATDRIILSSTAMAGSIGVVFSMPDPNAAPASARKLRFVSSQSPNKNPDPTSERGRAEIQRMADELAALFIDAVAHYRNVSTDTVINDFHAGGMLIGQRAVDVGMADAIGTEDQALTELAAVGIDARYKRTTSRKAQGETMDWKGFWSGFFEAAPAQTVTAPLIEQSAEAVQDTAAIEALSAQLAAERQARAELEAKQHETARQAWAEALIRDGKITPAEQDSATALYAAAQQHGFAALVEAAYSARPAKPITTAEVTTILPVDRTKPTDINQRKAELLALSPLGQAALKQKEN